MGNNVNIPKEMWALLDEQPLLSAPPVSLEPSPCSDLIEASTGRRTRFRSSLVAWTSSGDCCLDLYSSHASDSVRTGLCEVLYHTQMERRR
jgi:hypothetical protein